MKVPANLKNCLLALGVLQISGACSTGDPASRKQPNIIFILADDLGYSELGCYGNTFNETPRLDEMAAKGIRFTHAYASAPVCSPYRVSLMTGLYPARTGITDYLRPNDSKILDTSLVILPEALRTNGYHTGIIGKWHLSGYIAAGAPIEILPDKRGFNEVMTSENRGIGEGTYFYPYHFNPDLEKILPGEKEYLVDRMNREAVEFIERNHQKPFFLYISHYAVHTTLHGRPDIAEHFKQKPGSGQSSPSTGNPDDDPYRKYPSGFRAPLNNPHLAAQLKSIDEGVGMIQDKLRELKIDGNTIVIFTSDNGGESRVTTNYPLRDGKSTLYEGGIREPLIIYQPGRISGGKIISTPTANYDFLPTICDLTGTPYPATHTIDGVSIAPLLLSGKSTPIEEREFFWHYPLEARHFLGGRSAGAIRSGAWKLIEFFDTSEVELYNLDSDPEESENMAASEPEIATELKGKLSVWRSEVLPESR